MRVDIERNGFTKTIRKLEGMEGLTMDLRPAWRRIMVDAASMEEARFKSRGNHVWKPLEAKTIRRKHGDDRINIRTGELLATLTDKSNTSSQDGAIRRWDAQSMTFGSNIHQAQYANRRRSLIFAPQSRLRSWARIVEDHILDGWRE